MTPEPTPGPSPTLWRRLRSWLKLAIALGLLAWLGWSGAIDPARIAGAARDPVWAVETAAILAAATALLAFRWCLLLRFAGVDLPYSVSLRLTLIAFGASMVLPGGVSGDLMKLYAIGKRSPGRESEAYTTVAVDRVLGLGGLIGLALAAALANTEIVFQPDHAKLRVTFYGIALAAAAYSVGLGALVLGSSEGGLAHRLVATRLARFDGLRRSAELLLRLGTRPWVLVRSLVLALGSHVLYVLAGFVSARALGEPVIPVWTYAFVLPVAYFVNAIPLGPPGGLGTGEKALQELMVWVGGGPTLGAGVMLLNRVGDLGVAAAGAVAYVLDRDARAETVRPEVAHPEATRPGGARPGQEDAGKRV